MCNRENNDGKNLSRMWLMHGNPSSIQLTTPEQTDGERDMFSDESDMSDNQT